MPPEKSPTSQKHSRSLGVSLGVTEVFYTLGLLLLAIGSYLLLGIAWTLCGLGLILLGTAFYNDAH